MISYYGNCDNTVFAFTEFLSQVSWCWVTLPNGNTPLATLGYFNDSDKQTRHLQTLQQAATTHHAQLSNPRVETKSLPDFSVLNVSARFLNHGSILLISPFDRWSGVLLTICSISVNVDAIMSRLSVYHVIQYTLNMLDFYFPVLPPMSDNLINRMITYSNEKSGTAGNSYSWHWLCLPSQVHCSLPLIYLP